jgi:hypothetical protein
MKLPLPAIVAIFASSCAVSGAPFERAPQPPDTASIYVYRPYHYGSSLLKPAVTCGGQSASIGTGGYHVFVVPTGTVTCTVEGETSDAVTIDADARRYYIREEFSWGRLSGHPHLNPVDHDNAHDEIASCCVDQNLR